jgi:hypothetical protein
MTSNFVSYPATAFAHENDLSWIPIQVYQLGGFTVMLSDDKNWKKVVNMVEWVYFGSSS